MTNSIEIKKRIEACKIEEIQRHARNVSYELFDLDNIPSCFGDYIHDILGLRNVEIRWVGDKGVKYGFIASGDSPNGFVSTGSFSTVKFAIKELVNLTVSIKTG